MSASKDQLLSQAETLRRKIAVAEATLQTLRDKLAKTEAKITGSPTPVTGLDLLWKAALPKSRERSSKQLCRVEWNRISSSERPAIPEAITALKPDLVIAWETGNPGTQVDKLRALGLTVYSSQPNRMDDIAAQLTRFGQLAGSETAANAAAAAFRQRLAQLRAEHTGKPPVRVFYQIWKAPLMTVGGPQIISDTIRLCGGENVFGKLEQMSPTVSVEAVLAADPEAIVASGMGDSRPEWLDDWSKWTRLTAVRRGNLFHINPDLMQRHTPRILDGAAQLCAALDVARSRRPAK